MFYVYYLLDPKTLELLYIGRSNAPQGRKADFTRRNSRECVFGLHQRFFDFQRACKAELTAIAKHKPPYNKTLTSSIGSFGMCGVHGHSQTNSTKQKISQTLKGLKRSEETKAKMSKAQKGLKRSDAVKAKLSAAHMGIRPSAESRAKQSAAREGRTVSEETRAKIGKKAKERHQRKLNAVPMPNH